MHRRELLKAGVAAAVAMGISPGRVAAEGVAVRANNPPASGPGKP
jgi:hypothetical protein